MNTNIMGITLLVISLFVIFIIITKTNRTQSSTMPAKMNIFKKIFSTIPLIFQIALDATRCIVAFIIFGGVAMIAISVFKQLGTIAQ